MNRKVLMKGNHAVVEGALGAGCAAYFGYPITPQNEVSMYMSMKMEQEGRVFIQSESELAAINMVFGASLAGVRAMTSSSSPGISLQQEGISYMAGCELPGVIVNVQRGGPGLGNISGSQGDYFQSTRGGGHGDYRTIVLAPSSVQEMFDLTESAFDLADRYRNPVLVLADGVLGQMIEPVAIGPRKKVSLPEKNWVLDGCDGRKARRIRSLFMEEGALEKHNLKLKRKYDEIVKNEVRCETENIADADILLVSWGITARICKSAMAGLRERGIRAGLVRPVTLWPFPERIIYNAARKARAFLVVEMNLGQMVEDVRLAVNGRAKVFFYGRPGGGLPEPDVIAEKAEKIVSKRKG